MAKEEIKFGKKIFVDTSDRSILDNYEVEKKPLGKGGYGTVYKGINKKTGEARAIKKLPKKNFDFDTDDYDRFLREIEILKKTDHPNIIKLYELYESKNSIYLVMEKCDGGELFDDLITRVEYGPMYTEKEVAIILKQVMSAVEYCHNNKICHRDLKPENILFSKKLKIDTGKVDENNNPVKVIKVDEKENPIKVIDFGLGQNIKPDLASKVGTAYYVAPEIIEGKYSEKCDIWSSGVILYILLCGDPPFNGPNDQVIYKKIKEMKFKFSDKFKDVSKEAKDLIRHMIAPEKERYSAKEVLEHKWFDKVKTAKLKELNFDGSFLKEYINSNHLKKLVLLYIASRIGDKEISELKEVFKAFDKNNDGQIDLEEFKKGLKEIKSQNFSEQEISEFFSSIDTDKNNKIDYTEFLAATLEKKTYLQKERLFEAFCMIDKDNNGKITKNELKSVLQLESADDKLIADLMSKADTDNDGVIDYQDFLNFMGYKK